ncbi:hypothetical protein GCM10027589_23190 [Actinocorallia lasiicapitis]
MNDASVVRWRKSSYSGAEGGDCVEVAGLSLRVMVRDSKNHDRPALAFGRSAFDRLTREIRAGRH